MATRSSRFPLRDATIKHVADEGVSSYVSPEKHSARSPFSYFFVSDTSCAVDTRTFFHNISPIDDIVILLILEELKIKMVVAVQ